MISYAKTLMIIPETILIKRRIKIILAVSLKSLFFNNTNNPSPALDKSPLMTAPKEIVPFMSIIVMPIEIAQFGIRPTIAAIIGCIILLPFIISVISTFARK